MQRRHFELIARVIKTQAPQCPPKHLERLAEDMADELAGTNAGFDRARFLKACGAPEYR